ncbi:gliding motility-associated peptidyl-prolyl isomerase GldI [Lutibacter sp. A64]|uniref:gliding motility-associated peptidyl-prolyl isomerase GldI n=1 Tax=Lutibacter sp. A64 TaxID=2918526 RepID=UPI001F06FAA1|nr:gliding motility-associated peptidyl-prolyl isomerase GldI [Lutibacter sp. A64]UMB54893.1 gliding motility-associated peptidyl-prolyl isomerase GldI [Lutibacter sp. A64]
MKPKFFSFIILLSMFSCVNPEARKPVLRKSSSVMQESIEFNKALIAAQENAFEKFIKQDSVSTYFLSNFGFKYKINTKASTNYYPKKGDEITYTYEVYDINMQPIYTKNQIGVQKYIVDQQEIVDGLREGLKLMNAGDDVTFLFPSHKVFGYLGDQKNIEVNQPLIYKVQLIKINKQNESN